MYDQKHSHGLNFKKGMEVLKKDFLRKKRKGGKLDAKWVGPYVIVAALGKGFYSLKSVKNPSEIIKRINGAHLKPYKSTSPIKSAGTSISGSQQLLESSLSSQVPASFLVSSMQALSPVDPSLSKHVGSNNTVNNYNCLNDQVDIRSGSSLDSSPSADHPTKIQESKHLEKSGFLMKASGFSLSAVDTLFLPTSCSSNVPVQSHSLDIPINSHTPPILCSRDVPVTHPLKSMITSCSPQPLREINDIAVESAYSMKSQSTISKPQTPPTFHQTPPPNTSTPNWMLDTDTVSYLCT